MQNIVPTEAAHDRQVVREMAVAMQLAEVAADVFLTELAVGFQRGADGVWRAHVAGLRVTMLGGGSNVLIADAGIVALSGHVTSHLTGEPLAEFAGRACYQSWTKPNPSTATNAGYLRHILEVGHLSVLEHGSVTFYLTGVSRSLTHELIRHRHFSYSQLSQRYVPGRDAAMVEPDVIATGTPSGAAFAIPIALIVGLVLMLLGHVIGGLALFGGSILAATAVAFARSLGDFGVTLMVAGNIPHQTQTAAVAMPARSATTTTRVRREPPERIRRTGWSFRTGSRRSRRRSNP